jgi:hypothetical protein
MDRHIKSQIAAIPLLICCALSGPIFAQTTNVTEPRFVAGDNNETTKAELDLLAQTARRHSDHLIFIIARLGNGERSRRLNRRRLHAIRDFLKQERFIPEQRLIAAEGEPMRGLGRVEVYLGGKLFMVFTLPRNKFFAPEG